MAGGVTLVYLDIDDEITTAAARIRTAPDARVGMVVPFGSRVATARINFRLLAREAHDAGRRLDIVAPDASARALASERFWKRLSFARPPEVTIMSPDQVTDISDATDLLVDQQDVTPLGLAYQAIELHTTEDPLDATLRRVLRVMKV